MLATHPRPGLLWSRSEPSSSLVWQRSALPEARHHIRRIARGTSRRRRCNRRNVRHSEGKPTKLCCFIPVDLIGQQLWACRHLTRWPRCRGLAEKQSDRERQARTFDTPMQTLVPSRSFDPFSMNGGQLLISVAAITRQRREKHETAPNPKQVSPF